MLARLIFFLLIAAFAIPSAAPATCHHAPVAAHAGPMHDTAPVPQALPVHACVGCIPPADWLSPRLMAPTLTPVAKPTGRNPNRLFGTTLLPDLPPPRHG